MLVAFVGTVNDESDTPISGNGKTCSMTGYGYLDYLSGKHIWSNYKTTFSEKVCGLQEMIETIGDERHPDTKLMISEMQKILNSIGSSYNQILFIDSFCSQLRKLDVDMYYDTQRFNNCHLRLRVHTDVVLVPYKTHMDNSPCNYNLCKKPHKIYIYSHKPYFKTARKCFDASIVGELYDTNEYILDQLIIPDKKKVKAGL